MDKVYQAGSGRTEPLTIRIMPENRPLVTTQSRSRTGEKARSERKIRVFSSSFADGRGAGFNRFRETANRPGRRGCKKIITACHNLAASLPSSPFSRQGASPRTGSGRLPEACSGNRRGPEFQKTTRCPQGKLPRETLLFGKTPGKPGGGQNCTSKPAVIRSWSQSVWPSFSE